MIPGDPFKITFDILGGVKKLFDYFFAKGYVSLFLVGAQGTGKTSFRKTLEYLSVEDIRNTKKSTLLEKTKSEVSFDDGRTLDLVCYDYGGDDIYHNERRQAIIDVAPLAILFFVDHRDTRKDMPRQLRLSNNYLATRSWEIQERNWLSQIDPARIEEHRRHFDDLCLMIQSNATLNKYTKLIVPVVTKYDIWYDNLLLEEFGDYFSDKISMLGNLNREVAPFMAASPVEYFGTPEIMNEVFKRSGRIYKILNWTWRKQKEI
jgi:hypothetical protein